MASDILENVCPISYSDIGSLVGHLTAQVIDQEAHDAQENAAGRLATMTEIVSQRILVASYPGALDGLVRLLAVHNSSNLQEPAARALANLAETAENKYLISTTGVIGGLVRLLEGKFSEVIKCQAARGLNNLAKNPDSRVLTARFPTVLQTLVHVLKLGDCISATVQDHAISALFNLSETRAIREHIMETPGVSTHVAKFLKRHDRPTAQVLAAFTLANLATGDKNRLKFVGLRGVVEGLVGLLHKVTSPVAQEAGTKGLRSLTIRNRKVNLIPVARCEGALEGLSGLIAKPPNGTVAILAANVLRNLAKEPKIRCDIAFYPGTVKALVGLLKTSPRSSDSNFAAGALANLSEAPETRFFIARSIFPGALQDLIELVFAKDTPNVQLQAATLLGNLAAAPQNSYISKFPEVLEGIVGLLDERRMPKAHQEQGARIIANLAASDEEGIFGNILPRFMPGLVGLLYKDEHPRAQQQALEALGNLADSSINKFTISQKSYGALEGMVRLMSPQFSRVIQDNAARAVANMCEL